LAVIRRYVKAAAGWTTTPGRALSVTVAGEMAVDLAEAMGSHAARRVQMNWRARQRRIAMSGHAARRIQLSWRARQRVQMSWRARQRRIAMSGHAARRI
jgi:hypothetical protein